MSRGKEGKDGPGGLTPRQSQIAALVAKGKLNKEIAEELAISFDTVRSHLRLARKTLGARNRTELAAKYVALGGEGEPTNFG